MGRRVNQLTAMQIGKLTRPGVYGDGANLWLQVSRSGTKAWLFRFMKDGRARKHGLGPFPDVGIAEARAAAFACRAQLRAGIDPIEAKREARGAARAELARQLTFAEAAARYVAAHRAGWRNADHARQWVTSLRTYAFPAIGSLPVGQIDTPDILRCLEPIWMEKAETASRLRGRIENVLDWATARGFRAGPNPARWKAHLKNLLPARRKVAAPVHHPALAYREMPSFMAALRGLPGMDARLLEFSILTAARSGEAINVLWAEVDLAARIWTIPPERMKGNRPHRVPLSDRAMEILETAPRDGGRFVFAGNKAGKAFPKSVLQRTLKRMGRTDITPHGFRSTFRDWASEQTAYPSEMCEMALAHIVSSKVEAAYRRGDMLEKRRRLMADWAEFCSSSERSGDNVRNIRGAAQ